MSFFPGLHGYRGYRDVYWDTREPQLGLAGEGVRGVLNPFLGWPFKTFMCALHVYLGVSFVIYAPPTFYFFLVCS